MFDRERRYTLRRRSRAIYGTVVRVIVATTLGEAEYLRGRARAAVLEWCRHAPVPIRFEGELLTRPLELVAPCSVTVRGDDLELVAAHPPRGAPGSFGLYRGGLTLLEGRDDEPPGIEGIAFKASSRRLDHTLTRDAVIHDVGYTRVLKHVRRVVRSRLCERVFSMLEKHVWSEAPEDPEEAEARVQLGEYLYDAAIWHVQNTHPLPPGVGNRSAFRSPAGLAIGLNAVSRALDRRGVRVLPRRSQPLDGRARGPGPPRDSSVPGVTWPPAAAGDRHARALGRGL